MHTDTFQGMSGRIHYVFAREDEYYLDSLVRLGRRDYLFHCLRKEGFGGIFHVTASPLGIRMDDLHSRQIYPQGEERKTESIRGIGRRMAGTGTNADGLCRCSFKLTRFGDRSSYFTGQSGKELLRRICAIASLPNESTVVVIPMELCAAFLEDHILAEDARTMIGLCTRGRLHAFVLTADPDAADVIRSIHDPGGESRVSRILVPPRFGMDAESEHWLCANLPESCFIHLWKVGEEEQLKRMLRRMRLEKQTGRPVYIQGRGQAGNQAAGQALKKTEKLQEEKAENRAVMRMIEILSTGAFPTRRRLREALEQGTYGDMADGIL